MKRACGHGWEKKSPFLSRERNDPVAPQTVNLPPEIRSFFTLFSCYGILSWYGGKFRVRKYSGREEGIASHRIASHRAYRTASLPLYPRHKPVWCRCARIPLKKIGRVVTQYLSHPHTRLWKRSWRKKEKGENTESALPRPSCLRYNFLFSCQRHVSKCYTGEGKKGLTQPGNCWDISPRRKNLITLEAERNTGSFLSP